MFKNNVGQREEKKRYESWANGMMIKKQKVYHPYLEVGYKFAPEREKDHGRTD